MAAGCVAASRNLPTCHAISLTVSDELSWESAVKRSVILEGKRTSVSLEDEFWLALRGIAKAESKTVSELIVSVARQDERNLSSALRVYVLRIHERLAE